MAKRRVTKDILTALCAINEAMLRVTVQEELFQQLCDAVVAEGQFMLAAAMLAGPDDVLHVVAGAGPGIEGARMQALAVGPNAVGTEGLAAAAIRSGLPAIANDYLRDARCASLWPEAKRSGMRSAAAIPFRKSGEVIGALLFEIGRAHV